jgi:hypothetical protein
MQALSVRAGPWDREEKLQSKISALETEAKEWKSRYARTKTQLRSLRASSIGLSSHHQNAAQLAGDFMDSNGLVKDVYVTRFQIAIDELLRIARSGEPARVLEQMKSVVLCVRHVTQAIPEDNEGTGAGKERIKQKARVSGTANNLITASKNFASSQGLSPVSLLDAAASHLTTAIVELLRSAKIRPTPANELEEEDDMVSIGDSPSFFSVKNGMGRASGESNYSSMSSPRASSMRPGSRGKDGWGATRMSPQRPALANGKGVKMGFGLQEQDDQIEELRVSRNNTVMVI